MDDIVGTAEKLLLECLEKEKLGYYQIQLKIIEEHGGKRRKAVICP